MKKIILYCAALMISVSCGIYKKYERPENVVADSTLFGEVVTDTTSLASLGWRELFTDPQLQSLIQTALDNNTDLKKAQLSVEQAYEGLRMARLAYIPTIGFAPQGSVGNFNSSFLDGGINTGAAWNWTVPFTASWEVDIFGKLTNRKRQAKVNYDMAGDYALAVRTGLIAGIATQYYTLLMLDEQLAYTRETVEKYASSVEVLKAMMAAGMANQVAVSQMEGALCTAAASAESIAQSITEIENGLCALLGETPQHIARGKFEDSEFPSELKTGVPASLLERRPDIRSAENALASAYYGVNVAKAALLPSISLSGQAGWTNNLSGSIMNPTGLVLGAAASLFQPVFHGGALRGQLRISKSQMEQARLSLVQTILNAGAEVNTALSLYQKAIVKEQWRNRQIESLSSALENTEMLMRYTSTTYLEVLTAQQSLLGAETGRSADRLEKATAVINLYRALGGGCSRTDSTN